MLPPHEDGSFVTTALTLFALIGFAANSILCRLALQPGAIDAVSFTTVRLVSGAVVLALVVGAGSRKAAAPSASEERSRAGSWTSAMFLFFYALPFSLAYVSLGVATGALILFLSVQATMLVGAVLAGEPIHWLEGVGILVALGGLLHLMAPGLSAPSPAGAAVMAVAGVAWGVYSLRGRRSTAPIRDTAANFLRAAPLAVLALAAAAPLHTARATRTGLLLACASGVLASGAGYAAWFAALPRLKALQAAALQLTVPVIAAIGGALLLGEHVTSRLVVSSALILGGVGLALGGRAIRARAAARVPGGTGTP